MSQETVKKLVEWIKSNSNYSVEELKRAALQGGTSEEDFNVAMGIVSLSATEMEYEGVGKRFVALVIDGIFFVVLKGMLTSFAIVLSAMDIGIRIDLELLDAAALLLFFMYYVLLEWKAGGTLGKLLLGMRVIKLTGEPLDLKAVLVRNILRIIDWMPFFYLAGAIAIWNSKKKQRIGDIVAKTGVVSKFSLNK